MEANRYDPIIGSEGEDAEACQVLEIINGNNFNAFERAEEAKDVWSVEMGDDSVFYSDEEQTHQDRGAVTCSANKSKHLVNSVAGEEIIIHKENSERKKDPDVQMKLQMSKTELVSDVSPVQFGRTRGEILLPNFTASDVQTQNESNGSRAKENHQVREEEVMAELQTSHPEPHQESDDRSHRRLGEDGEVPQQFCVAEPQKSDSGRSEEDPEAECSCQVNTELPQNPNQALSASPQPKKPDCSAFNHLASSKYSTVSYRRIQKGNTRQKIEEFEFLLKNQ